MRGSSSPQPPRIRLTDVIADRRHGPVQEVRLAGTQKLVAFAFQGQSWTTRSDGLAYMYRLKGCDVDWKTTRDRRVEYQDLPLGEYTFQVRAIDRDLNYSEPAGVYLTVLPDPLVAGLSEILGKGGGEFLGNSPALYQVQAQLSQVASTALTVLIRGETGTGKGLAARTLHSLSPRKVLPFIPVNCGAIPKDLVESELFGHERGAFTGATSRKLGKAELAQGGTLFLDEIGDLPLEAQVKLLHLLEEKSFERVGGTEVLKADVRVVAATNRDLEQMVEEGSFRPDLYYRLQVFPVRLPPLRERQEDIPLLAEYFTRRYAQHLSRPVPQITPGTLVHLQSYSWPGNVRELEHLMQRAVLLCRDDRIEAGDVVLQGEVKSAEGLLTLAEQEKRLIARALEASNGVIFGEQGAARLLGINPQTFRYRIKKHGIHKLES